MTPNYLADARALVIRILTEAGGLSNTDPRAFETIVAAVARDMEREDAGEAAAHLARLEADSF